jgi:hypothetical protein
MGLAPIFAEIDSEIDFQLAVVKPPTTLRKFGLNWVNCSREGLRVV